MVFICSYTADGGSCLTWPILLSTHHCSFSEVPPVLLPSDVILMLIPIHFNSTS